MTREFTALGSKVVESNVAFKGPEDQQDFWEGEKFDGEQVSGSCTSSSCCGRLHRQVVCQWDNVAQLWGAFSLSRARQHDCNPSCGLSAKSGTQPFQRGSSPCLCTLYRVILHVSR